MSKVKLFIENFLVYGLGGVLSKIVPLIMLPIITRLMPDTFYFGLNGEHAMTLEEIGEKFNLTRERVRQIKEKAIRRLRQTSRSKALKAYLG